ncbi:hypothetical protein PR048_005513 [Dryococelus australis]|uniref:Uncharacterized protein n=1 Tax=Dryococelus australis TaxID=614101 RepID=A0ABQ9I8D9_9NEOP|nr:hypothetical protein PR048_005513 [Dryococelus australis]
MQQTAAGTSGVASRQPAPHYISTPSPAYTPVTTANYYQALPQYQERETDFPTLANIPRPRNYQPKPKFRSNKGKHNEKSAKKGSKTPQPAPRVSVPAPPQQSVSDMSAPSANQEAAPMNTAKQNFSMEAEAPAAQ